MPFKDYSQVAEPLRLPINGKTYTIPPLTIAQGITLTEHLDPESTAAPMNDAEFTRFMLGDALDEMIADGVPDDARKRAVFTALADHQRDRSAAELMWETGGDPKAIQEAVLRAQPQDHKPAATTRPAAARTTKRPASGTGTKTSRKS